MNIDMIDASNILINLCEKDISAIKKEAGKADIYGEGIKGMMKDILSRVESETGIILSDKIMVIEALPYVHGCLLLLRLSEKKKHRRYRILRRSCTLTYSFLRADDVLCCTGQLFRAGYSGVCTSLMYSQGRYYLVFHSVMPERRFSRIMHEYAVSCRRGTIFAAAAAEHSEILCSRDAISRIGRLVANQDIISET